MNWRIGYFNTFTSTQLKTKGIDNEENYIKPDSSSR
jgi:hypothetical protein